MKKIKSIWVQQVAAWITIILFVYLILDKAFKVMISQPLLFITVIALGIISSSLLFSIHAYLLSKKVGTQQNVLETTQTKLASKLQEGITSTVDHVIISIADLKNEIERGSFSQQVKFPLPDWLTGADVIRIYAISYFQLKQHVTNGLPAYPPDTSFEDIDIKPFDDNDILFEMACDEKESEYKIARWLFRLGDIESFANRKAI